MEKITRRTDLIIDPGDPMARYTLNLIDRRVDLPVHDTKKYGFRAWGGRVTIHHSLTQGGSADAFSRYHVETNNWPGIGYHYVVEKNGDIAWCWDHNVRSYHAGKHNAYMLGICLTGNFLVQHLEEPQHMACLWLLHDILNIKPENVFGHSELEGYDWKDCPSLSMKDLRYDYVKYCERRIGSSPGSP